MSDETSMDDILLAIEKVITSRKLNMPENSYVASLLKEGPDKFLKKIGEESAELIIAAKNNDKPEIIFEAADLLFHTLVLLGYYDISVQDIYDELKKRFKSSTIKS